MADAKFEKTAYTNKQWEDEIWGVVYATCKHAVKYHGERPTGNALTGPLRRKLKQVQVTLANKAGYWMVTNPYFSLNRIYDDGDEKSPVTDSYMRSRTVKKAASAAQGLATGAAKSITVVDPVSMAKAGASAASTLVHMYQLDAIAKRYKQSTTIAGWVGLCMYIKQQKLCSKAFDVCAAAMPYLPPGTAIWVQALSKLPSAVGGAHSFGVGMAESGIVMRVAIELQWRAYREKVLARGSGPVGPASAILYEIFTKRSETKILGAYDVEAIIREPAGWYAISDKLANI
jgi:hypothetical protein